MMISSLMSSPEVSLEADPMELFGLDLSVFFVNFPRLRYFHIGKKPDK